MLNLAESALERREAEVRMLVGQGQRNNLLQTENIEVQGNLWKTKAKLENMKEQNRGLKVDVKQLQWQLEQPHIAELKDHIGKYTDNVKVCCI